MQIYAHICGAVHTDPRETCEGPNHSPLTDLKVPHKKEVKVKTEF